MIAVVLIALLCFFLPGCAKDEEQKAEQKIMRQQEVGYKIVVNTTLVCKADPFGYVTEGSVCYDISRAEKGYQILLKRNGETVSTTNCPQNKLDYWLDMVEYKISVRDSLVRERGKK
jgi:hypothetical protein